ncbi:hypothetical protein [Kitasatospora sp. NPDC088779]|uniref:hypothetical protein n=1 Tax=Kitasatospora sp. NPDC088779 TaxID=3154964 RepID=UPI003415ACFB
MRTIESLIAFFDANSAPATALDLEGGDIVRTADGRLSTVTECVAEQAGTPMAVVWVLLDGGDHEGFHPDTEYVRVTGATADRMRRMASK